LNSKDKHIIESFIKHIKGNNIIKDSNRKTNFSHKKFPISRLALRSDKMLNDLYKLGIIQNKTYNINIPNISLELERHFWRGIFDGDGHISTYICKSKYLCANKKYKIYQSKTIETGICGHVNTMESFKTFLLKNNIKSGKILPEHSIFRVRLNGSESIKFLDLLYNGCDSSLYLTRKYNKYIEYKNEKNLL